jgi:fumarate hydratase subunit alpha
MREIDVKKISDAVRDLAIEVNIHLSEGLTDRLRKALEREQSELGRELFQRIIDNARAAREKMLPACQDTGTAVVLLEIGQDVHLTGGSLIDAINDGVRRGWRDGQLRASILGDPLTRVNSGDNTPAVVHTFIVPGDRLRLSFMAKGSGCENMSRLKMLKPSDGEEGIVKFVEEAVVEAGGRACPPMTIGVGVGGDFELAALLAKKALFRDPIGARHADKRVAALEEIILARVNATGIGPLGMGGTVTALAVHVETAPVHISSLPVAVNIDCHAHRHRSLSL